MLSKVGYLAKIKKATKNDEDHPRHKGIKMQAHHLLSAKGIDMAGLSDELDQLGYKINELGNLIFLPSTLQGACHLVCQLHRGDHKSPDPDSDLEHPKPYHVEVSMLVSSAYKREKMCKMNPKEIQRKLDYLSEEVADAIDEYEMSLTRISDNFKEKRNGCMGLDNIPPEKITAAARKESCPCGRDHSDGKYGNNQKNENITYKKAEGFKKYSLKAGR